MNGTLKYKTIYRNLKNFESNEPRYHARYFANYMLQERYWPISDLEDALQCLTITEMTKFIPELFKNIWVECFVFGNCTPQLSINIYSIVQDALETKFKSK